MNTMHIIEHRPALNTYITTIKNAGSTIAFVPTMGNLHAGHLQLIEKARTCADIVIVSIFVNPTQFSDPHDLELYPRTLQTDIEKLETLHVNMLFTPSIDCIYPDGAGNVTLIDFPELSGLHCGASRPGHFQGVATVVRLLFDLVQPNTVLFGKKDYQQLLIIRKLVARFYSDPAPLIDIVALDTVRENDGLALSSRNQHLSAAQRLLAPQLHQTLIAAQDMLRQKEETFDAIAACCKEQLENAGLEVDYFAICHAQTLQAAQQNDPELIILAAVFLGHTRLIDNMLYNKY